MIGSKKCELCLRVATIYCDADQANLCWDCDGGVHSANFLVAKHTRCLLCRVCQSPSPWIASGCRIWPTVSVCESCVVRKNSGVVRVNCRSDLMEVIGCNYGDDGAEGHDDDEDDEEDEESDGDEEDEDEVENEVVPWPEACELSSSSSIGSGEEAFSSGYGGNRNVPEKMKLGISDLHCYDEVIECSSAPESNDSRPLKRNFSYETSSKSTAKMKAIIRNKSDGCETPSSSSSSPSLVVKTAKKSKDFSC